MSASFDHATLIEQVRDVEPTARYAVMGSEAFAEYHREVGQERRALRDLPVISIYSRDLPPKSVWVFDNQWKMIRELSTQPA